MDQSQRELRRAAAKAFQESLEQLGQSFLPEDNKVDEAHSVPPPLNQPLPSKHHPAEEPAIDVKALEEAAADIEQFMQSKDE